MFCFLWFSMICLCFFHAFQCFFNALQCFSMLFEFFLTFIIHFPWCYFSLLFNAFSWRFAFLCFFKSFQCLFIAFQCLFNAFQCFFEDLYERRQKYKKCCFGCWLPFRVVRSDPRLPSALLPQLTVVSPLNKKRSHEHSRAWTILRRYHERRQHQGNIQRCRNLMR